MELFDKWIRWAETLRTPDLANATVALLITWERRVLSYAENPVLFRKDLAGWSDNEIRMFDVIQQRTGVNAIPGTKLYEFSESSQRLAAEELERRGLEPSETS